MTMENVIQGTLFRKPAKRLIRNSSRDFELAHDVLNGGKVEVTTFVKNLKDKLKQGRQLLFEVCLTLHGFKMQFTYSSQDEALRNHKILCQVYRDF